MPWYRHILWPFAIPFGLVVWLRNRLFDLGVLPSSEFEIPIICIGNLETGGTGKSPLVHYTVKTLQDSGLDVVVLSRGYGRSTSGFRLVSTDDFTADAGDEPLQIKLRYPNTNVVVCENRVEGVKRILSSNFSIDVIVMDDGFQHRWIKPSLSILVTPASFPFWKNALVPVGSLREAKRESKRARALVFSGGKVESNVQFDGPVFSTEVASDKPVQLLGPSVNLTSESSVVLLSGIANSDRFENSVSELFKPLHHSIFSDHHQFSVKDLQNLREIYNSFGAAVHAIITTEKDAVRLRNSPLLNELEGIPVFYLPIDVEFLGTDKQAFDKMILAYGKHA